LWGVLLGKTHNFSLQSRPADENRHFNLGMAKCEPSVKGLDASNKDAARSRRVARVSRTRQFCQALQSQLRPHHVFSRCSKKTFTKELAGLLMAQA
jgi:hypothetical protein